MSSSIGNSRNAPRTLTNKQKGLVQVSDVPTLSSAANWCSSKSMLQMISLVLDRTFPATRKLSFAGTWMYSRISIELTSRANQTEAHVHLAHTEVERTLSRSCPLYMAECPAQPLGVYLGQRHFSEKRVFSQWAQDLESLHTSQLMRT